MAKPKPEKPPVPIRIPAEVYEWADEQTHSGQGFRSVPEVLAHVVRFYKEAEEDRMMRRELFKAWVAGGKKWPPPPGLVPPSQE